ncbi:PrpF domain-containing protein [Bacillus sp. NEB1478]|uniref:PrpF domain-containing protein n=1 Tax=Bacillus sp. NEB1478 TaxID=3073816 RepID=UPI002872C4BB|nr:PrpF domain-containing protein [Bacillus sp. NEB1478]WNB92527.1 PrpF domain-containing protein [Bacillus sp. NEB1478]
MLIYIAKAEGSVSSTVVIDGRNMDNDPAIILPVLSSIHSRLQEMKGYKTITKYAVIQPSSHPMYDLNYFFFQLIPGEPCRFEYTGSCGHSILASIQVAITWGWISSACPGLRVRVYVENIGNSLVCEVDQATRQGINCTAHFIETGDTRLGSFLLTGNPSDVLETEDGVVEVSLISAGNPYVFVDAKTLGCFNQFDLFQADEVLFQKLQRIRIAASKRLGWNPESVFPKIAAVSRFDEESLSVRAISVPKWHPTLALTGTACLGVASAIKDTVVYRMIEGMKTENGLVKIVTQGGTTCVSSITTGSSSEDRLLYNSISNKNVQLIEPINLAKGEIHPWKQPVLL